MSSSRRTRPTLPLWSLLLALAGPALPPLRAQAPDTATSESVVRAVLFHSPTCPHCRRVIEVDLPPLLERYGPSLRLAMVDASVPEGNALYRATVRDLGIPRDRVGVPTLVMEAEVLVGSGEIPARFPSMADAALARGGTDWPAVEPLRSALEEPGPGVRIVNGGRDGPDAPAATGPLGRFLNDPVANSAAVTVLLLLAGALVLVGRAAVGATRLPAPPRWALPTLALLGAGVAAYLSIVEVTGSAAVCGPVGDCNTVQQSPWARLFGVLPVGLLGLVGYAAVLGLWGVAASGPTHLRAGAWQVIWAMALFGTVLSVYLTFLEPFVIGATCLWCLASALLITGILLTATPRALDPETLREA